MEPPRMYTKAAKRITKTPATEPATIPAFILPVVCMASVECTIELLPVLLLVPVGRAADPATSEVLDIGIFS